jgi:6-phosphogluconate dehydrogenase (decarboxylating)
MQPGMTGLGRTGSNMIRWLMKGGHRCVVFDRISKAVEDPGTPKSQLAHPGKPKVKEGLSPEEIGKMEQEMESLERDLKSVEESHGESMLC